jgi:hypothetical protein
MLMRTLLALCLALSSLVAALAPQPAMADPADINAAARGVVRVVIVSIDGSEIVPVSHGTGFAVSPERIVTNAHVVEEARGNANLAIAIVPSDGESAVYGRLIALAPGKDLALIATTTPMHLPPLTIAGGVSSDSGAVTAVGYPMNVDQAQGLNIGDLFRAQPPVKSTGFLSGNRPTRDFDSLLHTAPIARGNSGGPLLDECGRVLGVNSFGATGSEADAEFFFAVSMRELLPFLRANSVTPQVNGMPCRSLKDLEAEEQARTAQARADASARTAASETALARRRDALERESTFAVLAERDNAVALAMLLLMVALGSGFHGWLRHQAGDWRGRRTGGAVAGVAIVAAAISWFTRPGFADVEERVADQLAAQTSAAPAAAGSAGATPREGKLVCVLDPERSRVTGAAMDDVPLQWSADGCVNGRTQYGLSSGSWARVFVPDNEAAVSVNRFDPATGEYRMERYLLGHEAMDAARKARAEFRAPVCAAAGSSSRQGATELGARQDAIISLLPGSPNERLVYRCSPAS